ncbi:platelet-activating factor acetylhydrolase, isoform II domain-containing protein [Ditylenchus destructor]|uniref:1-alkyl-2-acetylglycerophosphocholine esterase n=1 Tax=Ditylenchus destructor TaxID=166010 RepID=A0AAD4R952_9BILA|nr:platelet-activating factor acetylhydrolase, isoform II domain-containing protein [Ditylenchus destructor]
MGLTFSSASPIRPNQKPTSVLPVVGNGEYEVGCADIMVKGEGKMDPGVFARLFYPSRRKDDETDKEYKTEENNNERDVDYPIWRPRKEYVDGLAGYRQMNPRTMHFFFDWVVGERRIPAGWHEPLYTNLPKFPIVIFSHGISGSRLIYSTFCASLASHGFLVAALEHRDRSSSWTYHLDTDPDSGAYVEREILMTSFPDGEEEFKARNEQLHFRISECVKALDVLKELNFGYEEQISRNKVIHGHDFDWSQFKNRLDISNTAVIGHSFGGAAALAATACSSEFRTSVVLDGWLYPIDDELYPKITLPALFINASKWQWAENVRRMYKLDNKQSEKVILTLKDIVHQSFSDFGFLMPGYIGRKFGLQGDLDPLDTGSVIVDIVATYLRECFQNQRSIDRLREFSKNHEDLVLEGTDLDLTIPPQNVDAN